MSLAGVVCSEKSGRLNHQNRIGNCHFKPNLFGRKHHTVPPKESPPYEIKSKIDMARLREAARIVFAYDPSAARKDSVDSPAAKHRKPSRKGSKSSTSSQTA